MSENNISVLLDEKRVFKPNEDFVNQIFIASTHDYVLFITSHGKAYWLKVHEIPEGSKAARGQNIKVILALGEKEEITATVPIKDFKEESFIFMATRKGVVKKVKTYDDLKKLLKQLEAGDPLVLFIRRERRGSSQDFIITLRIPE